VNELFFENIELLPFCQDFFNNIPDLFVFGKDTNCKFTMMNNCLLSRLGKSSESQVLGKDDFEFFQPNLAELFQKEDREVFEKKKNIYNRTWSVPNGQGGLDWYVSSKYILRDRQGEVKGLIGVMRGITKASVILEPYADFSKVLTFVQEHYSRQIEVSELASMMNLSVSQFERRFKALLNITPLKFINKCRIDNACEKLLNSNDTIATIALECGFYDHSYFSKNFKKIMSVSPHQYRMNYLK
jgi:AraC-like DNA-binding protein